MSKLVSMLKVEGVLIVMLFICAFFNAKMEGSALFKGIAPVFKWTGMALIVAAAVYLVYVILFLFVTLLERILKRPLVKPIRTREDRIQAAIDAGVPLFFVISCFVAAAKGTTPMTVIGNVFGGILLFIGVLMFCLPIVGALFKKRIGSVFDPYAMADFWVYGFFVGLLAGIIAPDSFIVPVWLFLFALPVLAAFAFGVIGAVLGMLGCK